MNTFEDRRNSGDAAYDSNNVGFKHPDGHSEPSDKDAEHPGIAAHLETDCRAVTLKESNQSFSYALRYLKMPSACALRRRTMKC